MTQTRKRIRVTVDSWTDDLICAHEAEHEEVLLKIEDEELPRSYLFEGAQLNLLLSEIDDRGRLHPQHIVLEPDFLVDVTAICRCATEMGDAPAHHYLQKFLPHTATDAIQLGAVANQFLDDVINSTPDTAADQLYRRSLCKSLVSDPLRFSTVQGIDASFSDRCRIHFNNIRQNIEQQADALVDNVAEFIQRTAKAVLQERLRQP